MALKIILTGDVNLMNVPDPDTPFRQVKKVFGSADLVFSNLECSLYEPPPNHSVDNEGFYVAPLADEQDTLREDHAGLESLWDVF
ncbi:hypothetical protein [Paralcaligenes ginsengisoli]